MSLILVDGLKDRPGTGGPKFPNGLHLPAGIGITGDGHINMAGVCTFSGNVTIGGTLTYEDVTNIDSVGVVTARSGVNVSGGEFKVGTAITVGSAGVSTFFGAVNLNKKTTVNATLEATEGLNVTAGVGTFGGNVSIADKIIHTGDTNTALRFPSADTVTVETGGSERIRVDSSGNFGVGTNNPSVKTQIYVTNTTAYSASTIDANQFQLSITNAGAAGVAGILLATEPSSGNGGHCGIRALSTGNGNSDLTFSTRGSSTSAERLRITSAGLVGIGTVTPDQTLELWKASGTNLLKVTSEANSTIGIEIEKTGATTQSWRIADGQTANGKLEIYDVTDSRSVMAFDGTGKVGVGTLSPGMQFHINGSVTNDVLKITANGSGQMVNLRNHSNVANIVRFQNYAGNAFWDAQYNTDDSFSLDYNDSTKFAIDSDGAMELTPAKNGSNNGFTVTPANGTTASSFQILGNNNAGADGRNGCATFIDVNYYATGSTIFNLAGRGTNLLAVLGNGNVNIGGAAVSQSRNVNIASNSEANIAIETHNDSTSESANIRFYKSGNTGASPQVVEANDMIAQLMAYGHDGTDYANQAAGIKFKVDGTPGSNDMPGAIQLLTNNGTGGLGNRFNISATGNIGWMGDTTASSAVQQRKRYSSISHSANTTYDVTLCSDFGNADMLKLEYAYSWNDGDGGAWGTAIVWKHHDGNHDIRYLGEEIASPPTSFSIVVSNNDVIARIVYGGSGMNGYRLLNVECVGGCSPAAF